MIFSNLVANLHQTCNLQCAFLMIFLLWCILFSYVCRNVLPAAARSTFLKTNSEQSAFKNPLFGALNALNGGSVGHLFGTYRSFARSVRLFSASVAHQHFNFRLKNAYFLFMSPIHKTTTSITLANLWKFQILMRICIKNVICKMHFWYFLCSDAFYFHIFAKMCSPLKPEAHFRKTTLRYQPSKIHFLEPWMP